MGGEEKACDAQSAAVFIIGLVAGTGCIIVAKMLFEMKAVGSTGEVRPMDYSKATSNVVLLP